MNQEQKHQIEVPVVLRLSKAAHDALVAEAEEWGVSLDEQVSRMIEFQADLRDADEIAASIKARLAQHGITVTPEQARDDFEEGLASYREKRERGESGG